MLSSRPLQLNMDGVYIPTKTPGHALKSRAENAHAGGGASKTVNGKGKNVGMPPRTPFQPASVQPRRLFKDQKTALTTTTRALGDKTPLPNRLGTNLFQTPLPQKSKLSKLSIIETAAPNPTSNDGSRSEGQGDTPESVQRPSSMRKHVKHPRNSGKNFETPMNTGNHWDVSDGDIVVSDAQLMQETIVEDEDDLDEVEYGPPNTLDLPYQPSFDFELPDYKEVGKTLRQLAFSFHYDDAPALPDLDVPASDLESPTWNMISLPPLESDDPFHLARLGPTTSSSSITSSGPLPSSGQPKPIQKSRVNAAVANAKPRPQSSLARLGATKAATSRPGSRAAPSTSTASLMRDKRVTPTVSVRSGMSNLVHTVSKATKVIPSSQGPTATTSLASSSAASSSRPRVAAVKNHISGMVSKPTQATRPTVSQLRPHTALAISTNINKLKAKATTTMTTRASDGKPTSERDAIFLIKDAGGLLENDDNFLFDV